ncbi:MAG: hypothetical protein J0M29_20650 [Chitinophagales bacterium]|nr:hypothetical protein [Chitinophagales bacterium]
MTYYRNLFILFLCLPVLVHAQLHNTMQRERLMALGIDSIEKTEILLDSLEEPVTERVIEKIRVNNQGFLTRIEMLDESGKCTSLYESDYLDTFLIENRYYVHCYDTISVMITRYQYDESKRLESFSFHSIAGNLTTVSHEYEASGRLLTKKQKFRPNKLTGSKGGKEVWQYTYAPDGTLARMDVVSGSGKKAKKRFYTYQYDAQNRRIATYVAEQEDVKGFLIEKRGYESNGELAFTDHCCRSATYLHSGQLHTKIPAGACSNTTYLYKANGLINEERISVDQKMKKIIQYKYF